MKNCEYEKELIVLYGLAIKHENIGLALEILERGREGGIKKIREDNEIREP